MLNDIGGHAKAYRAVAGLIMAEMPGALLDDELARLLAVAQHRNLAGVVGHLDGGRAALIAGGLGLLVYDIVGTVLVDERAAGHKLHRVGVAPLLHRALDGDQIFFFHGVPLLKAFPLGDRLPRYGGGGAQRQKGCGGPQGRMRADLAITACKWVMPGNFAPHQSPSVTALNMFQSQCALPARRRTRLRTSAPARQSCRACR